MTGILTFLWLHSPLIGCQLCLFFVVKPQFPQIIIIGKIVRFCPRDNASQGGSRFLSSQCCKGCLSARGTVSIKRAKTRNYVAHQLVHHTMMFQNGQSISSSIFKSTGPYIIVENNPLCLAEAGKYLAQTTSIVCLNVLIAS